AEVLEVARVADPVEVAARDPAAGQPLVPAETELAAVVVAPVFQRIALLDELRGLLVALAAGEAVGRQVVELQGAGAALDQVAELGAELHAALGHQPRG